MHIPKEILEIIGHYLSPGDKYQCLTVCKYWYTSISYLLYRVIRLNESRQVDQLQQALSNSHLAVFVRKIHVTPNKMLSFKPVGVDKKEQYVKMTQELLDKIDQQCLYIQTLTLNRTQWNPTKHGTIKFPETLLFRLTRLPPIEFNGLKLIFSLSSCNNNASSSLFDKLTCLHVRGGQDMFQFNNKLSMIHLLERIPNLNHLTFDRDEYQHKDNIAPIVIIEHFKKIHASLPKLEHLEFINGFSFGSIQDTDEIVVQNQAFPKLVHLKLQGALLCCTTLGFISQAYPSLKTLDLELEPGTDSLPKIRECFQAIAEQCLLLESIRIDRLPVLQWLTSEFIHVINQKPFMTDFKARLDGLDAKGVEKSIRLLTMNRSSRNSSTGKNTKVNLTETSLAIWKNYDTPTTTLWDSIIQPLATHFPKLTRLELGTSTQLVTIFQHTGPFFGFEIDTILDVFVHIKSIKLSNSYLNTSTKEQQKALSSSLLTEITLEDMVVSVDAIKCLANRCSQSMKRFISKNFCVLPEKRASRMIHLPLIGMNLDLLVLSFPRHLYPLLAADAATNTTTTTTTSRPIANNLTSTRFLDLNNAWYHLSRLKGVCKPYKIKVGKEEDVDNENNMTMIDTIQKCSSELGKSQKETSYGYSSYHEQNEWRMDLPFGYIQVQCQSAKKVFFNEYPVEDYM